MIRVDQRCIPWLLEAVQTWWNLILPYLFHNKKQTAIGLALVKLFMVKLELQKKLWEKKTSLVAQGKRVSPVRVGVIPCKINRSMILVQPGPMGYFGKCLGDLSFNTYHSVQVNLPFKHQFWFGSWGIPLRDSPNVQASWGQLFHIN